MSVNRDIYRAVHERKWLSVEYLNGQGRTTRYWVGVKDIDPRQRTLRVRGMHLGSYTVKNLTIRVNGIESSSLIDHMWKMFSNSSGLSATLSMASREVDAQ